MYIACVAICVLVGLGVGPGFTKIVSLLLGEIVNISPNPYRTDSSDRLRGLGDHIFLDHIDFLILSGQVLAVLGSVFLLPFSPSRIAFMKALAVALVGGVTVPVVVFLVLVIAWIVAIVRPNKF